MVGDISWWWWWWDGGGNGGGGGNGDSVVLWLWCCVLSMCFVMLYEEEAYLAREAVNTTISNFLATSRMKWSTPGRFRTYTFL
jgi:hypothetical protein